MWNADGLSTEVQELRDRLAAKSIEARLIQETKLTEKDASRPFPSYNSIRLDRPSTHRGGGLLTLVKEGIVFLAGLEHNPDLAHTGFPVSTAFSEPLVQNGRTFTTKQGKANAFMKAYAAVN